MSVKDSVIKVCKPIAVCFGLAGCAGGGGIANMDAGLVTGAAAVLGGVGGHELGGNTGALVGGTLAGLGANYVMTNLQACPTDTTLGRNAERDNITGQLEYDYTTQTQETTCRTYGQNVSPTDIVPIFRSKNNPSILETDEQPKAQRKAQPASRALVPIS